MLRPFQLTSGPIQYDSAGQAFADFRMPTRTRGTARCAIVGMSHGVSGDDAGVIASTDGYGTIISRITIGGRNYFQGDGVPLPLISLGPGPVNFVLPSVWSNRFLGTSIRIPGGWGLGQGTLASGMSFGPREEIRIRLERLTDDAFVNRLTLWGVQWPDDRDDPSQAEFERLRFEGIGETYFVGGFLPFYPAAGTLNTIDILPQPPSAVMLRRIGFRGILTDATDGTPIAAAGIPAAAVEGNLLAQISSSQDRSPQNQRVPFRDAMGLNGQENPIGLYDMEKDERSIVQIFAGGTAAQDQDVRVYVLHMFEGRDPNAPAILASNAVS